MFLFPLLLAQLFLPLSHSLTPVWWLWLSVWPLWMKGLFGSSSFSMLNSWDGVLPARKWDFIYGKMGREVLVGRMEVMWLPGEGEWCWGCFGVGFVELRLGWVVSRAPETANPAGK